MFRGSLGSDDIGLRVVYTLDIIFRINGNEGILTVIENVGILLVHDDQHFLSIR